MDQQPPKTPQSKTLTRDLRLQVHTLHKIGLGYAEIASQLNISQRQVQYAWNHRLTPQFKCSGAKSSLNTESLQVLIEFVCASRRNRRLSYFEIPLELGWDRISPVTIQHALQKEGFRKHPLSEKNRRARLAWALEHQDWTRTQWDLILWTDETWVTNRHTRVWVTRRKGEEYEHTCVIDKEPKSRGWMFWGSFAGKTGLGPGLLWKKAWGSINQDSYIQHVVPEITG